MDLSFSDYEFLINEWVFNKRDRDIMKSKILDGLTFEEVAELYDLTPRGVQYIVDKYRNTLLFHAENYKSENSIDNESIRYICKAYNFNPELIGKYIIDTYIKKMSDSA